MKIRTIPPKARDGLAAVFEVHPVATLCAVLADSRAVKVGELKTSRSLALDVLSVANVAERSIRADRIPLHTSFCSPTRHVDFTYLLEFIS